MIDLLKKNGPFFKANLHCHTTLSDGKMTARQVRDWYRDHGYSIVAFTDHSKYAYYPELRTEDFLPVAGFEAAFICLDPVNKPQKFHVCHINFLARDPENAYVVPETFTYDVGVINRYIAEMKKHGWLCTLNHPGWSLQTSEEINGIIGLDGFEVYNNGSQVLDNNGESQGYYSLYLCHGSQAFAVATDDNHCGFDEQGRVGPADDTLGGYVQISMPELSYECFADAFANGRFYASTGVDIHELYIDEQSDELVLSCSPVKQIIVKGVHTVPAARISGYEDDFTSARIPLAPIRQKEPFFRIELRTAAGKAAFAQPYYF